MCVYVKSVQQMLLSKRFTPLYLGYAIHIRVSYKKTGFWVVYYLHVHVHIQKDRPDDHIRRYVPSSETQVREKKKEKQNKKDKADVPRQVYIYIYTYVPTGSNQPP